MSAEPGRSPGHAFALLATATCIVAAALVGAGYAVRAWALVVYPWDWSPDEGLHLDYARRALEAPATLYARSVVPFPSAYGPLLPFLMAPVTRLPAPLAAARLLALAWTLVGAVALGVILGRRAGWRWALAGVALWLAPFELSFWNMLVRPDGPMEALWLCAAIPLLPRELARGSDRLSPGRLAAGSGLLLASVLVKPTAVLHGAPLVLGWFLVDSRSARLLTATVTVAGLAVLGLLEVLTHGSFLWVNRLWGLHPRLPGLSTDIVLHFGELAWPILAFAVAAAVAAGVARARPLREPGLLLILGGVALVPLMSKQGASWNYLLPLLAALVVVTGGWWTRAASGASRRGSWADLAAPFAASMLALVVAASQQFPLPTPEDEATSRVFYTYVLDVHRRAGGPILVARPDLAYFLVGQPEEVDGASFYHLVERGVPGTESVLRSLRDRRYTLVVESWPLTPRPEWREAIAKGYRHVGGCRLGWYFGHVAAHVLVRRDLPYGFATPAGTACRTAAPEAPS